MSGWRGRVMSGLLSKTGDEPAAGCAAPPARPHERAQAEEAKATGLWLAFRVTGSGPPLLLFHGVFGSESNWRLAFRAWAATTA